MMLWKTKVRKKKRFLAKMFRKGDSKCPQKQINVPNTRDVEVFFIKKMQG